MIVQKWQVLLHSQWLNITYLFVLGPIIYWSIVVSELSISSYKVLVKNHGLWTQTIRVGILIQVSSLAFHNFALGYGTQAKLTEGYTALLCHCPLWIYLLSPIGQWHGHVQKGPVTVWSSIIRNWLPFSSMMRINVIHSFHVAVF